MPPEKVQMSKLVPSKNHERICREVEAISLMVFPSFDFGPFEKAFCDVVDLFAGNYEGYRGCNTEYHYHNHTTDCLLAMARLMHGAIAEGVDISQENFFLGLVAALMHDTGYIQTEDDTTGTGAKYTLVHVDRSIDFMEAYFEKSDYSREQFEECRDILSCTGLHTRISEIDFADQQIKLLGQMLGSADLLGQMADRTYLEKLLFLYYEFREADVPGYENELDLLKKTIGFYEATQKRLVEALGDVQRYTVSHFLARWGIDRDMYKVTIHENIAYLKYILSDHENDYREYLRREQMTQKLEEWRDRDEKRTAER